MADKEKKEKKEEKSRKPDESVEEKDVKAADPQDIEEAKKEDKEEVVEKEDVMKKVDEGIEGAEEVEDETDEEPGETGNAKSLPRKTEKVEIDGDTVSKILVEPEDEVTFVIEELQDIKTKRVVVSIPEGSDLLVSSVAMKLIARHADENGKLVAIATNDPAGQNMARLAGLGIAPALDAVSDETWNFAKASQESRKQQLTEKPQQPENMEMGPEVVKGEPGGLVNKDFQDNIEESEYIGEVGEEEDVEPMDLGRPRDTMHGAMIGAEGIVAATGAASAAKAGSEALGAGSAGLAASAAGGAGGDDSGDSGISKPVSSERTVKHGSFEMKVDDGTPARPEGKVMPVPKPDKPTGTGFVGRDFASYSSPGGDEMYAAPVKTDTERSTPEPAQKKKGKNILAVLSSLPIVKGIIGAPKSKMKKLLVPVFLIIVGGLIGVYWYTGEVVAEIDVESIPVAYQGEITAKTTAEDIDENELMIPARAETATNNGSDSTSATGTAVRGEKASGSVTIYNMTDDPITVAAGTVLSNGGLGFALQSEVVVPKRPDPIGMGSISGDVIAQDVGSEYNLAAGTTFTVGSIALSELSATNPSAFSGGSKEEYSVVSQADIDGVADELKKKLYAQSKEELAKKYENTRWTYVSESVKNELDGDVSSDVPAGAEQDSVNVDVKTKSTALYYDSEALDELIETLLMNTVGEDSLDSIELSDNMEKDISVTSSSVDDGTVVISVSVSGFVTPLLDEDEIERNMYGKSWAEGIKYLKDLEYVSGDPEVTYYPEWIPEFAWRMPSRKGQITVKVNNVVPEDEEDQDTEANDQVENETTEPE
jgi:hypothetical protein